MNEILEVTIFLLGILFTSVCIYEFGRIIYAGIVAVRVGRKTVRATRPLFEAKAHILIAGDSTAVGVGCSQPRFSIAGRIIDDFPDAHVENIAANGISTRLLRDKLVLLTQQQELHNYYDVLIIHTGGMDVLFLVSQKRYKKLLTECLTAAHKLARQVILVSPPNVGSSPLMRFPPLRIWYTFRSRHLRKATLAIVQKLHVHHVDLFTEADRNPLRVAGKSLYASDHSHPNDDGYAIWYKAIKSHLLKILK